MPLFYGDGAKSPEVGTFNREDVHDVADLLRQDWTQVEAVAARLADPAVQYFGPYPGRHKPPA
jgi:hypothetical protein